MIKQQTGNKTRTVQVLLTKYSDCISSFLYYMGGKGYTHASISLEEEDDSNYYSFNYKGFCVETIEKHRKRGVSKSIAYELTVSCAAYEKIQERLLYFKENRENFSYTRLGLFFCLLHIPFCWKNHYFCSQFVADLLTSTEEIALKKPSALYLPNHFQSELGKSPYLKEIRYGVV